MGRLFAPCGCAVFGDDDESSVRPCCEASTAATWRVLALGRRDFGDRGSSDRRPDHAVHPLEGWQAASTVEVLVTQFDAITTEASERDVREA